MKIPKLLYTILFAIIVTLIGKNGFSVYVILPIIILIGVILYNIYGLKRKGLGSIKERYTLEINTTDRLMIYLIILLTAISCIVLFYVIFELFSSSDNVEFSYSSFVPLFLAAILIDALEIKRERRKKNGESSSNSVIESKYVGNSDRLTLIVLTILVLISFLFDLYRQDKINFSKVSVSIVLTPLIVSIIAYRVFKKKQ